MPDTRLRPSTLPSDTPAASGLVSRFRRHRRSGARTVLVALMVGLLPASAAATADDRRVSTSQRLAETERRAAEVDRRIDSLEDAVRASEAHFAVLSEQLDTASAEFAAARDTEQAAEREAEGARLRAERADTEVLAAERELEAAEERLQELAWHAYVHGRSSVSPVVAALGALRAGSADELADRLHYVERTVGVQAAVLETSVALAIHVEALRERARAEHAAAEASLAAAARASEQAAATHARVLHLANDASTAYEQQQRQLEELAREREQLATDAATLRARVAEERRAAEARRRAAASRASGGGSGPVELVTVGGITVAASIAPDLEALLDAARADGIVLGGMGYRSPEVTAQLRRANGCPDVYDSPASACRIPTARPGTSEHERGLAIDFTWQGRTICFPRPASACSGNAAFDWLAANASSYGLYNLPSEAWHWSTSGR